MDPSKLLRARNDGKVEWNTTRCQESITRSVYLVFQQVRVVSQPFCVDKLNPAGLISVRATLPIYLIDQVSSLQRRAERRNGKFKKIIKTSGNIVIFIR